MHTSSAGLSALLLAALLSACSSSTSEVLASLPDAQPAVLSDSAAQKSAVLGLSSAERQLSLRHWSASTLAVTIDPRKTLRGPVSLRLERADGEGGDVIEVTPGSVTLKDRGVTAVELKLRPTQVAFPAPGGPQSWRLVASQGGQELGRLPLTITLATVEFSFTLAPVTAREGQTVSATLTVDADSREVPPFTFSLSPYIPDERTQYELVDDPQRPAQYRVTSLPATFQVPILLKSFPGVQLPPDSAAFQLSVDGLNALGSGRYGPKYVRANLYWKLAR
ncbi:hypothetical protein [Deinococcus koreensis]|uniref:Lipoprotein n=1 Tax=Deinococcus koreensis TaxID=2054903 RepID=A0A2K3UT25_9DEIO|nr:hypothetical protein [Deinococcus koreensis]PNY79691.1 hypothetical protein CVO96_17165 [Deinococcus koreensis]